MMSSSSTPSSTPPSSTPPSTPSSSSATTTTTTKTATTTTETAATTILKTDHVVVAALSVVAISHLIAVESELARKAPKTLVTTAILLIVFGFYVFGYAMNPEWHRWVCQERGCMALESFQDCPPSRMALNLLVDVAGNVALPAYLASTFVMDSVTQVIWTATLLYAGCVFVNIHHYMWEGRALPLMVFCEDYQFSHRVLAAVSVYYLSQFYQEELPGQHKVFTTTIAANATATTTTAAMIQEAVLSWSWSSLIVIVLVAAIRFGLSVAWYGPLLGDWLWLPAMRDFKRDEEWPYNESADDIPKLIVLGVLLGLLQSLVLLPFQEQMGAMELLPALKLAAQLFLFFVLPSWSLDLWEGKTYGLSFTNYSLYLVELCLLFATNSLVSSFFGQ